MVLAESLNVLINGLSDAVAAAPLQPLGELIQLLLQLRFDANTLAITSSVQRLTG